MNMIMNMNMMNEGEITGYHVLIKDLEIEDLT